MFIPSLINWKRNIWNHVTFCRKYGGARSPHWHVPISKLRFESSKYKIKSIRKTIIVYCYVGICPIHIDRQMKPDITQVIFMWACVQPSNVVVSTSYLVNPLYRDILFQRKMKNGLTQRWHDVDPRIKLSFNRKPTQPNLFMTEGTRPAPVEAMKPLFITYCRNQNGHFRKHFQCIFLKNKLSNFKFVS